MGEEEKEEKKEMGRKGSKGLLLRDGMGTEGKGEIREGKGEKREKWRRKGGEEPAQPIKNRSRAAIDNTSCGSDDDENFADQNSA